MNTNTTPRAKRTAAPSHPLHPQAAHRLEIAVELSPDALQRFARAHPEPDAKTLSALTRLLNTYHKLESLLHAGTAPAPVPVPSEPDVSTTDPAHPPDRPPPPGYKLSPLDPRCILYDDPYGLRNLPPLPPLPDDMIELLEQQRLAREAAEQANPTPSVDTIPPSRPSPPPRSA